MSAGAASVAPVLPLAAAETTTFAPSVRNSLVSLRLPSKLEIQQRRDHRGATHEREHRHGEAPATAAQQLESDDAKTLLAPQNHTRARTAQRGATARAADNRDQRGEPDDYRHEHKTRCGWRAKHAFHPARERARAPSANPINSARHCQQQLLRREKFHSPKRGARTQRLHHADFSSPFEHGG